MSLEVEEFLDALSSEEEYVNVRPALRVLMRLDERISKAVELLRNEKFKEAINLLKEAKLEEDQIIYVISTVLEKPLEEAENIYNTYARKPENIKVKSPSELLNTIVFGQFMQGSIQKNRFFNQMNVMSQHITMEHETIPKISWNGTAAG